MSEEVTPATTQDTLKMEIDRKAITTTYTKEESRFKALVDEVVFVLNARLKEAEIQIHAVEGRVKTLDSLLVKCERQNCDNPFETIVDIAGARVICLFKNDIESIARIISKDFDVISIDNKLE